MKKSVSVVDLLLFLLVVIWAANFTVVKVALREIPPIGFNVLRFIGSSIVFTLYYHIFIRDYRFIRENFRQLLVLSVLGNTIMQLTFIIGIDNTTASNASILYQTTPFFVALLTYFIIRDKVTVLTWIGICVSFIGIVLVLINKENGFGFSSNTFKGDILILVTSLCWSLFTVLAKPLMEKSSMIKVVSVTFVFGTIFLIPFGIPDFMRMDWQAVSYTAWGGVVYSFLLANVLGYIIWFYAVSKVGTVQTAIFSNIVPVLAVIIAAVYLEESITVMQITGGLCIIAGVTLTRLTGNHINKKPDRL